MRALVVVAEHLGVITGPAQRLDPAGRGGVPNSPGRPQDLAVGHIADQHVRERVLRLPGHQGGPVAADELPALQPVQGLLQLPAAGPAAESGDRTEPEHLPDHRGVLQQPLARRGQQVQPGADDGKRVQILAGLQGGERVVLNPSAELSDGDKVQPLAPKGAGPAAGR